MKLPVTFFLLAAVTAGTGCKRQAGELKVEKIYLMEKNGRNIPLIEDRDIVTIMDLPKTRQAATWTCRANAIQKVCEYYGEDYREMDLVRWLGSTPENGTNLQPMVDFLKKANFRVDVKEHMTRDEFLFADPSLYDIGYIPFDKLTERWHDLDAGDRKYQQTGIAVYGKKPKFDLEKIEEIK
jgi:hypothetical protein